MKTNVKVCIGLLGLALFSAVAFQNCAEPFATKLDGKYSSTGFGSSGAGASGGAGGGSGGATGTATPPPADAYTLNVTSKLYTPIASVAFDPSSAMTMVAVESVGNVVVRTDDGGTTWKKLCTVPASTSLYVVGAQGYGFSDKSVYRLVDVGGGTCPVLRTGTGTTAFSVASNGRLYFSEIGKPLSTSVDNGKTWTLLSNAISSATTPAMNPASLVFSRDVAGTDSVYAAVVVGADRSVYKITPADATKLGSAYSSSFSSFQVDPKTPANFYFYYYNYYVYASTDSGVTYKSVASADSFSLVAPDGAVYRSSFDGTAQTTTLSMKDSYASATWTPVGTFAAPTVAFDVNGKSIAALDGKKFILSKDGGLTYARSGTEMPSSALAIMSFAGAGDRLYAATNDFIFRSDDGGDSWVLKAEISGLGITYPRLQVSPGDVNRVYIRGDRFNSTYTNPSASTTNGFDSLTTLHTQANLSQITYGFEVTMSLGADPQTAATLSNSGSYHYFSDDIGWSMKSAPTAGPSLFIWYPWANSFLIPGAADKSLIGIGSTLYEYSFSANTMTAVASRVPFADPMGMEMRASSATAGKIWIVSQKGSIAESSDGVTFALKSSGTFGSIVTSSNNQGVLVAGDAAGSSFLAAGAGSNNIATTANGGASWKVSQLSGCPLRDAVAAKKAWLVSCNTLQPRFINR